MTYMQATSISNEALFMGNLLPRTAANIQLIHAAVYTAVKFNAR